jgi:hypothetical protein
MADVYVVFLISSRQILNSKLHFIVNLLQVNYPIIQLYIILSY